MLRKATQCSPGGGDGQSGDTLSLSTTTEAWGNLHFGTPLKRDFLWWCFIHTDPLCMCCGPSALPLKVRRSGEGLVDDPHTWEEPQRKCINEQS